MSKLKKAVLIGEKIFVENKWVKVLLAPKSMFCIDLFRVFLIFLTYSFNLLYFKNLQIVEAASFLIIMVLAIEVKLLVIRSFDDCIDKKLQ